MRFGLLFLYFIAFAGFVTPAQAQYTSKSTTTRAPSITVTSGSKKQTITAPAQKSFKVRPQAKGAASTQEGEDLPSFDVFEKAGASTTTGGQAAGVTPPPPPPPPPVGDVWFYITDFSTGDVRGKFKHCMWKVVMQNRTDTELKKMKIVYKILGEEFLFQVGGLASQDAKVMGHARYTDKCPAMRGVKPKVEITSCTFGPYKDEECSRYIVIK